MTLAPNGYRCMMMDAAKIGVCVVLLIVMVMISVAVAGWLDPPRPPPLSFDVMLDSASPGLKTHPCATDPTRACMSLSIRGMPPETP